MKIVDNPLDLEKDIKSRHFMDYRDFCEVKLMTETSEEGFCYRCNSPLEPLTYLDPNFYYCPCWNCAPKRKSEREALSEGIIRNIKDFYSKLPGDRYYQLFLVDDIYFRTTFPHDYGIFKKVISLLDPPGRNEIWFIDWVQGYPKIISPDNLSGLKIVNLSRQYGEAVLEKDKTIIGDYEIVYPELVPFDNKHHSRYSILNINGDRKSKRLKLGDQCIKLFNTEDDQVKSFFKLYKNGEPYPLRNLTHQDYVIIKLGIMRNKAFTKLIFDSILELSKNIGILRDSVFLKNTVTINPDKEIGLNLLWTPLSEYKTDNFINLSIL